MRASNGLGAPRAGASRRSGPVPFQLAALLVVAALILGASRQPSEPLSRERCLARRAKLTLRGTRTVQFQAERPRDGVTYDLRRLTSTASPHGSLYPLAFGDVKHGRSVTPPATGLCIIGGKVVGQQSRRLTWGRVKAAYDGDGLRIDGAGWYVVDGLRVDNVEDGIGVFGDGFVLRNLYFRYVRDDCIENDALAGGVVTNSLFDGCFMGVSQQPSEGFNITRRSPRTMRMNHVLMRLQPMPHEDTPSGLGNGQLFKWSSLSTRLVLRNSIFLVERVSTNGRGSMVFPKRTEARNVTLVWTGSGKYPRPLPRGVRIRRDRSIWTAARRAWLSRHGLR